MRIHRLRSILFSATAVSGLAAYSPAHADCSVTLSDGESWTITGQETTTELCDAGTGPNVVTLDGTASSLTLSGGSFGDNGGTIVGTGTLVKTGSDALFLNGGRAVDLEPAGTFVINNGMVSLDAFYAISDTTAVKVNADASGAGYLDINGYTRLASLAGAGAAARVDIGIYSSLAVGASDASTLFEGQITGGGYLIKEGAGTLTLTGANTYTGNTIITGGSVVGFAGTASANGSLQDEIAVLAGASVTFDQRLNPDGANGTFAGELHEYGTAHFLGDGTGVLTLTGNNSWLRGAMSFDEGSIVSVGSLYNLGTGSLNFDGGTLQLTASMIHDRAVTLDVEGGEISVASGAAVNFNGALSGNGGLTKSGSGTLQLNGPSSFAGGTTVSGGILQGIGGVGLSGDILNNGSVGFIGTGTYASDLSGSGNVFVTGMSAVGFAGANSYSGATTIDAGSTLTSLSNAALSSASTYVVDGQLNSYALGTSSVGGISGSGSINITDSLIAGFNNASTDFAGALTGATFTKVGSGMLTLSGTAGLTDSVHVNGGSLLVDGSLTAPDLFIGAGGTLLGGTSGGIIHGTLTNHGLIASGSAPAIITVDGGFVQSSSGTLAVAVLGNGSSNVVAGVDYSQLSVTGTASLAGTLAINTGTGLYVDGTQYHVITTTGGISGDFDAVTGNVISPFITLSGQSADGGGVVGTDYVLTVVRSDYASVAETPNQVAVADALQELVGVESPSVSRIDSLSAADARSLFDQLSPEPYAAYAIALRDQARLFARQVDRRQAAAVDSEAPAIWANAYGSWSQGINGDDHAASNQRTRGIAGGFDVAQEGFVGGIAAGYSRNRVHYRGGDSDGKLGSWQIGGYAGYSQSGFRLAGQATYSGSSIDLSKSVAPGSEDTMIAGTANSHATGHLFNLRGTAGYEFDAGTIRSGPYLGVDWMMGRVSGFSEEGDLDDLNLKVRSIRGNRADLVAGYRLETTGMPVSPYFDASWRGRISGSEQRSVSASFVDVPGSAFTVDTIGEGRSRFELDVGLRANLGSSASMFVGYQGSVRRDAASHGLNLGFLYKL